MEPTSNVFPLHRGHLTEAERAFDRDLRAERDRLHERYDPSPQQLRDARNYARMVADDYPIGVRFEEPLPMRSHEPVRDEPVAIFSADELVTACVFSAGFGALLTVGAAFVWSFWL